jgi:hypothetical protein
MSDFKQTCQDCYFGEGIPKVFKEFDFMKKSGCHGNQKKI